MKLESFIACIDGFGNGIERKKEVNKVVFQKKIQQFSSVAKQKEWRRGSCRWPPAPAQPPSIGIHDGLSRRSDRDEVNEIPGAASTLQKKRPATIVCSRSIYEKAAVGQKGNSTGTDRGDRNYCRHTIPRSVRIGSLSQFVLLCKRKYCDVHIISNRRRIGLPRQALRVSSSPAAATAATLQVSPGESVC